MNREHKYRVYMEHNGVSGMVYTPQDFYSLFNFPDNGSIKHILQLEGEKMQCTGRKDKNGKEIYEGDIILFWTASRDGKRYRNNHRNKVVEWVSRHTFTGFSISQNTHETWEVIGNIYENPELIK